MFDVEDTIVAIASAPGGAARGIVRVSGTGMTQVVGALFSESQVSASQLSASTSQRLADFTGATVLGGELELGAVLGRVPCDLYLWPTKRSYTGQPVAELHTIGAPPILDAVVRAVCESGARLAEPGEFTMRAFLGGRLDLTQAEAVLGVIDSQSQQELHVSLRQLAGGLSGPLQDLREKLIDLLAHLEAGLDFVEEDIEFISTGELVAELDSVLNSVEAIRRRLTTRGSAGSELRVALVGLPNVGKSSLLNALAGEAAAIVSDQAGTTRDYVTRQVALDGMAITLVDTAGIEGCEQPGSIAFEAQHATTLQQSDASLTLLCLDGTRPLDPWEVRQLETADAGLRLIVVTKSDVGTIHELPGQAIRTSSVTLEGITLLRAEIRNMLAGPGEAVASTVSRCHDSLRLAAESLERATNVARQSLGDELVAVELRLALDELGKVVGAVYTDDVLDRVFSRFCIGK
jgi:tRNA modification GTPase